MAPRAMAESRSRSESPVLEEGAGVLVGALGVKALRRGMRGGWMCGNSILDGL